MDKKWILMSVLSLCLAVPARTEESVPNDQANQESTEKSKDKTVKKTSQESQDRKVAKLASTYSVSEKEVQDLRDKGLGWGEIKHALAISQKSGKPISEIMSLRDSGMGWGKIAKQYGFKLGEVSGKGKGPGGERRPHGEERKRKERPLESQRPEYTAGSHGNHGSPESRSHGRSGNPKR